MFLCRPLPFWIYRILTDYDKLHCYDTVNYLVPGHFFFRSGFQIIAHSKLGYDLTIRKYNPSSK